METTVGNHARLSSLFVMNTRTFPISLDIIMLLPLLVKNANDSLCLCGLFFDKKLKIKGVLQSANEVSPQWSG
jgi:hypothetical protein